MTNTYHQKSHIDNIELPFINVKRLSETASDVGEKPSWELEILKREN